MKCQRTRPSILSIGAKRMTKDLTPTPFVDPTETPKDLTLIPLINPTEMPKDPIPTSSVDPTDILQRCR